jgi:chromosome segregation protein
MRLRKIRLAGFKSFVDPTTLLVPGNLVGIVGPNGCGKSNIIDAVTWVMGESSAKHLRGDSLTDVIFNGSNTRQPVVQASVELVFDNSEGRITGPYASYSEISVKRQITRDGVSTYFLNGTRCRRKDIQNLFLGTGLGPRSYAIIEQGMISRLIEAKPDELRSFIEEAAGISKFRERRRETETRMRHTRENLDRLNDIREELGRQLAQLQRQAKAAERYQELKVEERRLRDQLTALNWRELRQVCEERAGVVRDCETRVEEVTAALRHVEAEMEELRAKQGAGNDRHNEAQSRVYRVGAEISQLEQKIQHGEERIRAIEADLAETTVAAQAAAAQQKEDEQKLEALAGALESLTPRLEGSRSDSNDAWEALNQAEEAIQQWQAQWDAVNEAIAGFDRQLDVDAERIQRLEMGLEEMDGRAREVGAEIEGLDGQPQRQELEAADAAVHSLEGEAARRRADAGRLQDQLQEVRAAAGALEERLGAGRERLQDLASRLASLEALQAGADGQRGTLEAWLEKAGLKDAPRLIDLINVEPRWATAVETVLGERLQDRCAGDLDALLAGLPDLDRGRAGVLADAAASGDAGTGPRLRACVEGPAVLDSLLGGVFVADDLDAALALRPRLAPGESVVTPNGTWLGPDWLRLNRPGEEGVFAREQELRSLRAEHAETAAAVRDGTRELESARQRGAEIESALNSLQEELHDFLEQASAAKARQAEVRVRIEAAARRREELEDESLDLDGQIRSAREELEAVRRRMGETTAGRERLATQRGELSALRERHRAAVEAARGRWQESHQQSHEYALRLESISSQRASLNQALQRTATQVAHLAARERELAATLESVRAPLPEFRARLEQLLEEKIAAERELAAARAGVQELDAALREREQARTGCERRIEERRAELESARLSAQEATVRLRTVEEQLEGGAARAGELLQELPGEATPAAWQEQLEAVERRIQRLGPINLLAIEEFQQLSERKEYLDAQHADLVEALQTLEEAIRKIDRETRTRFQETFDRLNNNLKEMFPVLFGGGHAYLEMTGDDLLETGVTIMARPPGKRNSNIHLLSGGEKALTAVALVFAIFKLNPAPFCILDEVDAPLDDTNVGRFSNLVSDMSRDVQFIFITHNKITMEIAQQLLGVTMHEPGVSRLVSVDVEEAVQMAASA